MKILKQKNHGLPGLGINGKTGEMGQKAQSIYMGYINDFFDGEDISIGTFIYAAKRRQENISQNNHIIQQIVEGEVSTGSQDSSSINDLFTNAIDNSSSNASSYINYNTLYFTGNRLLNSSINNNIVSSSPTPYEAEIDLSGDYISMSFMLNTATKNEDIQAIPSTRIKQFAYENDASVDVKMNEKDNKFSSKDIGELYNIINQVSYYEFEDNAKLLLNSYIDDTDYMRLYAPFEANDAIYERNSDAGKAVENGTLLDNSSYSNYYTNFPLNSSITYVIDDISFNNNVNYYILDVNNTFSELYPISADASLSTKLTNTDMIHQFVTDDYDSWYYRWPELYKTSFKDDTYYTDKDLMDAENRSSYGVASPWLFLYKGTTNVQLNDASLLQLDVPQSYINNYKNANTYTSMLVSKNGLYVYYSLSDGDQVIRIPSTLKKEYVVGDVLYFYTNLYDYNNVENPNYQNLLYMVVLTEDLIGCTPTQLVSSAQLTSPLEIKFFSEKEKRLSSYNNIAVLLNKVESNQTKLSNKSLLSIIDNYTTAPVILVSSSTNNINTFTAFDSSDNFESLYGKINENNCFDISTSGNSTIKINSLYVTNNISDVTNVELYNHIYNSNIKFYENNFIRPLLDLNYYFDETSGASIFLYDIDANDYFYDVENLSDYLYGCDIYNSKMEKIDTIISDNKLLEINLVPTIENNNYYFQMFAASGGGLKYFSKITKLTLFYNLFNYYDNIKEIILPNKESSGKYWKQYTQNDNIKNRYQLNSFKLEILGDNQSILKTKKSNNIFFDLSNITAEQTNASLSIYANDPSIIIDDITFNRNSSMSFNNNWVNIQYDDSTSDVSKFNIDLSTNLPKYGDNICNTLNEYVEKGSDRSYESGLFTNLTDPDYTIPESKQRSILVTAKYHYVDNENENFYENFNIVQPGFKDSRGVPTIKLNSHTKIEELSSYNSIKNGILTNQFVTYVDIDINDFKKQWGQFVNEDVSIFMDISIRNIDYDLNWQYENIVENLTERRTFRTILEESDSSINHINNYVKFSSAVFETSENLLTKNTASCISTNGSLYCGGEFNLSNNYALCSSPSISENNFIDPSNGYILFDSSVINAMEYPQLMYSGIQDNILLELKDIPVCDDINTIKLKLSLEMGNPMLSNLYFRFVVDSINIKVIKSGQSPITFYTTVVPNQDTYLSKTTTDVDGSKTIIRLLYKYISDPIDVTFNPLSYIICPNDVESSYTNIYGNIQKYGIKEQIKKELKFFNFSVYEKNPYNYSKDTIRTKKYYPFNNLYIKKSYIQDNIKQISVKPISLWDTIKYIDCSTLSLNIDEKIIKEHNILDFIEGNKYLGIVYHSTIMQPRIENDQYIFHYNDNKYLRSKYNQKLNNMPVFAYDSQSIELRDDELINSMDKWNDYYASSLKYTDAKTYQGVLSLYGNGYTQILDTDAKDVSFYENKIAKTKYTVESSGSYNAKKKIIKIAESSGPYLYVNSKNILVNKVQSLEKVKELNDVSINLYKGVNEVDIEPMKSDQPNNKEYLRGFLYDINWEFPYYDNKDIWPYRIVSPFDNLLNNIDVESEEYKIYKEYYNALIDTKNSPYGTNMIPYNLLFDLNPRIAYNYENDGVNVLMLRRPSIGVDTDNITSTDFKEKYEFSNQLFDLTSQIEKLKSPYIVK